MKIPKKTAKPGADKKKVAEGKSRKMEPLKSKELKNQKFDDFEDEEEEEGDLDPEMMDDNFKGFEDVYDDDDDDM